MSALLTVVSVAHVRNTTLGNSVWRVRFNNGAEHLTKANGFGAEVHHGMAGKTFEVDFNPGGRITDMRPTS